MAEPVCEGAPRPGTPGADDCPVVLFVDDEPAVLSGLRRVLHGTRPAWRVLFADSGAEALRLLADQHIDVVVSDVRMPQMNGAELLALVRDRYPGVARLVLSGYADRDLVISAVGATQQFLSKPVDSQQLADALDRVLGVRDLVTNPGLRDLLGGVSALPKPPEIYQRMNQVTADPDYDIDDLVAVIRSDLSTSAEVLRLVNSSFFGLPTRVTSVAQAVTLLGVSTIQALAVAGGVFTTGPGTPPGLDAAQLSAHGLLTATTARRIAEAETWPPDTVADMFMAGLLHQIGLPVLAAAQPEQWQVARRTPPEDPWARYDACTTHLGCAPTQASAYLLGIWGFPDPVIHAVADQPADPHTPATTPAGLLLTYARHAAAGTVPTLHKPTDGYLDATRLARWQSTLDEPHPGAGPTPTTPDLAQDPVPAQ